MCCPRFFSAKKIFFSSIGANCPSLFCLFYKKFYMLFESLSLPPFSLPPTQSPSDFVVLAMDGSWLTANRLDDWQVGCWWMEGLADLLPHHHISCFLHPPSALPLPLFSSLAANPPSPISNPFSAQSISNPLKNISLHPLSNPFLSFASFQLSILIVQMILL